MKRRSFLQGMLGGAVAAPSMAKGAAAQLSDLGVSKYDLTPTGSGGDSGWEAIQVPDESSLRNELLDLVRNKSYRDFVPHAYVSGFDVDIAALHSVSLSAKMNMQRRRNAAKLYEDTKRSLERRLRDLLGASRA